MNPTPNWAISCPTSRGATMQRACCASSRSRTPFEPAYCSMPGALWNVFIMAASVRTLLSLFDSRFAGTIAAMRGFEGAHLDAVYQNLRSVDFSRDVLQGRESMLKVLTVPHCGWTDLGTPERVGTDLGGAARKRDAVLYFPAHVSLADQYSCARSRALNFLAAVSANLTATSVVEKIAAGILFAVGHERGLEVLAGRLHQTGGCRTWRPRSQTTTS